MSSYLGVDPGTSGALALWRDEDPCNMLFCRLDDTDHDIAAWLEIWEPMILHAMVERVSAFPGQGVSSTFKFGRSFGFVIGLLVAFKIPFDLVTPVTWQRAMHCLSKGDKNRTKARAQQLFPKVKIVHATADAGLIARCCAERYGHRVIGV